MKHARLSASAAHRWLHCAGSVNAAPRGGKGSAYAAAGTFAHDIAARCLADDTISPSDFLLKRETIDGFEVECDLEMVDAVRLYVDEIAADRQPGDQEWIEMPLLTALAKIDKDLGGTADHVRYRPATETLKIRDFKYGQGVYVDADDNEQLKLYALGALLEVNAKGHYPNNIEIDIVQPRYEGAKPVRSHRFSAIDLLGFAADVAEAADRTRQKDAPLAAGDWCKFCPAAKSCPELERKQHALLADEFPVAGSVGAYEPEKLAAALASIPLVKERIKALEEFAYAEALAGKPPPGFKLVDKRAIRKWKSEGEVILWAQERALDPYEPRSVVSPAAMEKLLAKDAPRGKKKEAGQAIEHLVERVSSGTVLVPLSDERPAAKLVAADDFPTLPGATVDSLL